MSKKNIKFSLSLNGKSAFNIEELREHFSPDIIIHYQNGTLLRWLEDRNMQNEIDKVMLLADGAPPVEELYGCLYYYDCLAEIFEVKLNHENEDRDQDRLYSISLTLKAERI